MLQMARPGDAGSMPPLLSFSPVTIVSFERRWDRALPSSHTCPIKSTIFQQNGLNRFSP